MTFPLVTSLGLFTLCALPSAALADSAADEHLATGLERFEAQDYERAISEFRFGFDIEPRPEFLFALGQAERLSGDCSSAITYYEQFLDGEVGDEQRAAAEGLIAMCRRALESRPNVRVDDETAPPAPARPVVLTLSQQRSAPQRPWYRDPLGNTLAATSAVSLVVGATFLIRSHSASNDAQEASTFDDYRQSLDTAARRRTVATVGLTMGAALGAAAVLSWTGRF